jgi:hypothetical protein
MSDPSDIKAVARQEFNSSQFSLANESEYAELFEIAKAFSEKLSISPPPCYVVTSEVPDIFYDTQTMALFISSALADNFSPKKLGVMIGHELGHAWAEQNPDKAKGWSVGRGECESDNITVMLHGGDTAFVAATLNELFTFVQDYKTKIMRRNDAILQKELGIHADQAGTVESREALDHKSMERWGMNFKQALAACHAPPSEKPAISEKDCTFIEDINILFQQASVPDPHGGTEDERLNRIISALPCEGVTALNARKRASPPA